MSEPAVKALEVAAPMLAAELISQAPMPSGPEAGSPTQPQLAGVQNWPVEPAAPIAAPISGHQVCFFLSLVNVCIHLICVYVQNLDSKSFVSCMASISVAWVFIMCAARWNDRYTLHEALSHWQVASAPLSASDMPWASSYRCQSPLK